jgi:CDGSH-type Zn-finger protein
VAEDPQDIPTRGSILRFATKEADAEVIQFRRHTLYEICRCGRI